MNVYSIADRKGDVQEVQRGTSNITYLKRATEISVVAAAYANRNLQETQLRSFYTNGNKNALFFNRRRRKRFAQSLAGFR